MSDAQELNPKEYVATLDILKKIDFLQGVPEEMLKSMLFTLQKQTFGPQKTILFQGEIANQLFIIARGTVVITTKNKGTKLVLATLTTGTYVGEISLLRPTSATATVMTGDEGADLLILTHDSLSTLSKKIPDIEARIQTIIDSRIASKKKAREAEESA